MIIDTSALVAILRDEPDAERFAVAIEAADVARISAMTYVGLGAVIDGARDAVASRRVDEFLDVARIVIEPVTVEQAQVAREAYRDFGKGSGHPAGLNLGDCFSYALARTLREPLLFKGSDFAETDIRPAADAHVSVEVEVEERVSARRRSSEEEAMRISVDETHAVRRRGRAARRP